MNKFTKGAIATGAGVVLLLGGAGTFALWNDSADLTGGTVNAGTLTIDADGGPAWAETTSDTDIEDIADFLVVPGDVITYTQDFTVNATGDNLEATLAVDTSSVNLGAWANDAGASVVVSVNGGNATIEGDTSPQTVTVVVTLTFPYLADDQNDSQGEAVDLSGLELTVTQNER